MSASKTAPPMSKEERKMLARSLRAQGLSQREIAEYMKISRSYAAALLDPDAERKNAERRERYRRPCPGFERECGRLMTGSEGNGASAPQLCAECARLASKVWTREAIIEAIQIFARENGRPPLSTEWLTLPRDRRFPPASAVYRGNGKRGGTSYLTSSQPFENWADAIEAAGFPRPYQGHRVYRQGEGMAHVKRTYVVLRRREDGLWEEHSAEGYNAELALIAVANEIAEPGEYASVIASYFVRRQVGTYTTFGVIPEDATAQ